VPNCKAFLVTEAERKHVKRHARFQHRDASCRQSPPPCKVLKKIHAILTETLGEHAPSYATVKNWVAQFKGGGSGSQLFPWRWTDKHDEAKSHFSQFGNAPKNMYVGSWLKPFLWENLHSVGVIPQKCRHFLHVYSS